jgi:hypothetical protein
MPRITPSERWQRRVLKNYERFKRSPERRELRREGLAILDRSEMVPCEEWWDVARTSPEMRSEKYLKFQRKCQQVGERFGVNVMTVEVSCLVMGYDPAKYPYVIEGEWPRVYVVSSCTNHMFNQWLLHETYHTYLHMFGRKKISQMPRSNVRLDNGSTYTHLCAIPFPSSQSGP